MVWVHGGGWAAGSGQEQPAYNGENLSRRGNVVVVSLNHRLNMLGYLNLAAYSDKFAGSVSAGVLDLVAALEWVHDNIASFGGDPGNVMIFGQSGGGGKVSHLLAMPSARGLFHKAAMQSGGRLRAVTREAAARATELMLTKIGLTKKRATELQQVPVEMLISAQATLEE